jgi:DNA-binding beta-propeller fold protein YncE
VEAFVTAETENRLLVVNVARGRVVRSVPLPASPEYIAVAPHAIVVVSAGAGVVTVLSRTSLRPIRELAGFASPHLPGISPNGAYAYVTDDARGTVTTIRLSDGHITGRIYVGAGAHHFGISHDGRTLWVALGQAASEVVLLDASDPARPRVVGHFDPGFRAHAVVFAPGGRQVWITAASGPDVGVFGARDHRLLFTIPGGAPPQHLAFALAFAYITSGYGGTIEQVDIATGRVRRRARAPYGSFELDAGEGFVVSSSLLRGTLAIYDSRLDRERVLRLAPATEDVALAALGG